MPILAATPTDTPTLAAAPLPAGFRRLAWSNLAAQSAEQLALAAAPLVAVLALGAGPGAAGLLQAAQTLPFLLLALPAGLLADRLPRPALMASAEALRATTLILTLALALAGGLSWPLLALLGGLGAAATVVFSVAAPALVPALVPAAALARANGRLELARTAAYTGGPALGGLLAATAGGTPAFAAAALLSLAAAGLLAGLREPPRPALAAAGPLAALRAGAGFVRRHRLLRPVWATQAVFNLGFFLLQAVWVPHAVQRLGLSAAAVGATLALYGVGMLCGALAAGAVARRVRFGTLVAIGPVAGFAGALAMLATLAWPSAIPAGLGYFLLGAGPILWVIATTTLRQRVTPPALLGRVSGVVLLTYGARPLGAGLGAAIGATLGTGAALAAAAALFGLQAAIILASPAARLALLPDAAAPAPVIRPAAAPRAGAAAA